MNAALSPNQSHVAVGLDSKCRLMAVQDSRPAANKSLRRRLKSNSQLKASDDIRIEVVTERQTDFLDGGAFQKVVRFSRDGSMLATGGADSSIRVWTVRLLVQPWSPSQSCIYHVQYIPLTR